MRKFLLIVTLLLAVGCTNIKYIGESYPPTSRIDIFFAEEDIERSYKVMGHADATAPEYVNVEKMMEKIKEKAMEKGADAVVVLGLDRNVVSESTEWSSETKVEENKTTESGRQTTSTSKENEIRVLFIKYRGGSETETKETVE
jgi:hypothetical protein